jgi:hypothetical protein
MASRMMFGKRPAGRITNNNDAQISRCFQAVGKRRRISCEIAVSLEWKKKCRKIAGAPWRPAIRSLFGCQNVAGLWLKYGVKPPKPRLPRHPRFFPAARRFVDNNR